MIRKESRDPYDTAGGSKNYKKKTRECFCCFFPSIRSLKIRVISIADGLWATTRRKVFTIRRQDPDTHWGEKMETFGSRRGKRGGERAQKKRGDGARPGHLTCPALTASNPTPDMCAHPYNPRVAATPPPHSHFSTMKRRKKKPGPSQTQSVQTHTAKSNPIKRIKTKPSHSLSPVLVLLAPFCFFTTSSSCPSYKEASLPRSPVHRAPYFVVVVEVSFPPPLD